MNCYVITIARSFGSDGGEIARRLSEKLNIRFVDKELLQMASNESGISEALFHMTDEKLNRKIFRRSHGAYSGEIFQPGSEDYLTNKNLFAYQSQVLKNMQCGENSFVVVGRAANYVLREFENVLRVNIRASLQYCIENIGERNCISEQEAKKLVKKTDRYREEYYNYFTGEKWNDPTSYDLSLNSEVFGVDKCVDIIIDALKKKTGIDL